MLHQLDISGDLCSTRILGIMVNLKGNCYTDITHVCMGPGSDLHSMEERLVYL